MKTLLVMAGGTGGHVIPALSVAKELRDRGVRIVWMGTRNGIESTLVPEAGFELRFINIKGLRGTGVMRKLVAPFVLISAAFQALIIIISSRATALLGMGGFASGPGGLVGWILRKPLIIHEQNAIAGTTNKILASKALKKLSGFSQAKGIDSNLHTGNPVKPAMKALDAPAERLSGREGALRLLVVGGSLGAQVFNEFLPALLKTLSDSTPITIRHQSGKGRNAPVESLYEELALECEVSEFINDMPRAYEWADFVICRSGAMTVSEVAAAGVAALFVPYPHAIDDHQWFNAQELAADQSALCYRQPEFEKGSWVEQLASYATDRTKIIALAEKAQQHARLNATEAVADVCMEVLDA
ncbi:MAG: UDP-N-acetylglucosamine--N-acetylmuramyl-(pentapeptide) pyrophosphoryl-undecaprenol N-acetylglucosamine transferase [Saprospiraceae bacterium]|jgi:UDP-N-acetylglucosamine--N-acetylmuramyl-(pentapeptide) pyrophosphoryl-undecaprenol N-acetylglucosamine transferase